jgi:hypothetical protein
MKRMNRIAIAALAIVPFCFAQEAPKTKTPVKKEEATTKQTPAAAQGVVVVKDPETGQIRQATPAEIGAMSPGMAVAADAVAASEATVKADGSRSMRLGEDSMNFAVVSKTKDGKLVTSEVVGERKAKAAVDSVAPKAAPAGELK